VRRERHYAVAAASLARRCCFAAARRRLRAIRYDAAIERVATHMTLPRRSLCAPFYAILIQLPSPYYAFMIIRFIILRRRDTFDMMLFFRAAKARAVCRCFAYAAAATPHTPYARAACGASAAAKRR